MLVSYIRSSSYNNYDYCQQQYFLNYNLGHPTTSGKKAQMGTIVHKVMESLARCKLKLQQHPKGRTLSVNDDALGKITFSPKKLYSDEFVNKLVDDSFNHYSSSDTHTYSDRDYKDCNKWSWMALDYNEGQFDPRNRKIVAPEPHFDIEIKEPWASYNYTLPDGTEMKGNLAIKGTIDLVTEVSDGVIEVVDWKTGKRINWATGEEKTYEKLQTDPQLLLYYYAISSLFPDYDQTIMTIFYIKDGGPFSLCFEKSDRDLFLDMLRTRFYQIKNNKNPKLISQNQSHWKCTKLCDFAKNNWPGTDKTMCQYVHEIVQKDGIDEAIKQCTKEDFSLGYYSAPG